MSCRQCTSGKSNTCEILGLERRGLMHSDQKTRFSLKGKLVYNYCAVSSFSEYTVVHSGCVVKVSPLAPLEKICLLSCGVVAELGPYIKELSKAGGAIQEFVNPKLSKNVALSARVGFTMMEMWLAYAPVKNNAEDAAKVDLEFLCMHILLLPHFVLLSYGRNGHVVVQGHRQQNVS
ncbi:hypothetical protein JHK86_016518 [Glycine max]|nr:hypothetical protein JHK86_016518 [Glycine max]